MWLLLAACQEPFGADRHDLVGFRIAAVSVPPAEAGDVVAPRAAVIVDGRAWSPQPVDLAWYWVSGPDEVLAIDPLTEADAAGASPLLTVPDEPRILAVVARRGSEDRRAFVEVARPPATIAPPAGFDWLDGDPAAGVDPGDTLLIRADADGLVRWMATGGTFTEVDRRTTEWTAADVVRDGDEVVSRRRLPEGPYTLLALALGEPGETSFRATEVHVGPPGPGLWVGGRWLPTDALVPTVPGQALRGTLAADDDSPVGLRLEGAAIDPAPTDYGTEGLDCLVPRSGSFDPGWLLEQICGRDPLVGAEVVVRVSP